MARTTVDAVKGIIEVDELTIPDISPFIETAHALVNEVCLDAGYGSNHLELIERWLAAHFYAVRDPRIASESAGSVSASYQQRVGLNLQNTSYGQQAIMLDTAGGLAKLNEGKGKRTVSAAWLGTKE